MAILAIPILKYGGVNGIWIKESTYDKTIAKAIIIDNNDIFLISLFIMLLHQYLAYHQ